MRRLLRAWALVALVACALPGRGGAKKPRKKPRKPRGPNEEPFQSAPGFTPRPVRYRNLAQKLGADLACSACAIAARAIEEQISTQTEPGEEELLTRVRPHAHGAAAQPHDSRNSPSCFAT